METQVDGGMQANIWGYLCGWVEVADRAGEAVDLSLFLASIEDRFVASQPLVFRVLGIRVPLLVEHALKPLILIGDTSLEADGKLRLGELGRLLAADIGSPSWRALGEADSLRVREDCGYGEERKVAFAR